MITPAMMVYVVTFEVRLLEAADASDAVESPPGPVLLPPPTTIKDVVGAPVCTVTGGDRIGFVIVVTVTTVLLPGPERDRRTEEDEDSRFRLGEGLSPDFDDDEEPPLEEDEGRGPGLRGDSSEDEGGFGVS